MKTLLISQDLWDIVDEGFQESIQEEQATWTAIKQKEYKAKDAKALFFIQQGVSNIIFPIIMNAKTAKKAWEILESYYKMEDDVRIHIEDSPLSSHYGEYGPWKSTKSICRVDHKIRMLKEEDYTPTVVSIGPFHYGTVRLQGMERVKQGFLKRFIDEAQTSFHKLVNFVQEAEPKVRASYSEDVKLNKRALVNVILLGAAFIIELFRKFPYISEPWLGNTIVDLLLLENQLPFFILEKLYNMAFPHDFHPAFLELTYQFFELFNLQGLEANPDVEIMHFTDLLRLFHLPKPTPKMDQYKVEDFLSYSANKLQEAGVKFSGSTSKCLLDLKFKGRVLEIPEISVDNHTETLFRNMIALEQCCFHEKSYITDYAMILDCLVNSDKDVEVLIHNKIIHNGLGDTNDVAKVFNGLLRNVTRSSFISEYQNICRELNEFYRNPWHNMKATLKRDYCQTPWKTVASIAGIVLLILTFVQTIFSILK